MYILLKKNKMENTANKNEILELIMRQSDWLQSWLQLRFENMGLPEWSFTLIDFSIRTFILGAISYLFYFLVKRVILHYLIRFISKTKSKKDDFFVNRKVFHRLSHLVPTIIIYSSAGFFYNIYPTFLSFLINVSIIYLIFVIFWSINGTLRALEDIYNTMPYASERPIRSYMQIVNLISYFVGFLIVLSVVFDIQITKVFAGLGAMAAVLMLIFKDSILGFTAGIQLSANKMVRVGDWISMPSYNADGDVLEISLNTVKVQNWDKTITTVPTYALVSSPFINWRGMSESGGRRIKRSINLDMRSVKFCTTEMLEKYKKIHHLKSYIEDRQKEIEEYNEENNIDESVVVNGRRMTNLGVFRKYLENYLRQHPQVNTKMTFLVRHLQPTETGIPFEIYVFCSNVAWVVYESVQADIFDHILAVIPEFDLKVFQLPAGDDLKEAIGNLKQI